MTPDELLAEIDSYAYVYKPKTALRKVVELHKPKDFAIDTDFPWIGCKECERLYPCPTIQTIEKELG